MEILLALLPPATLLIIMITCMYFYYKCAKKNRNIRFAFFSKTPAIILLFLHVIVFLNELNDGIFISLISSILSFIFWYLITSFCRFIAYSILQKQSHSHSTSYSSNNIFYEHLLDDISILSNHLEELSPLVDSCIDNIKIRTCSTALEFQNWISTSKTLSKQILKLQKSIDNSSLLKPTPATAELLYNLKIFSALLMAEMNTVASIYKQLFNKSNAPSEYSVSKYRSDLKALNLQNEQRIIIGSEVDKIWKSILNDICNTNSTNEVLQKEFDEATQELMSLLIAEKEEQNSLPKGNVKSSELKQEVYNISKQICNPETESSVDVFYGRCNESFDWDKRLYAVKKLLKIILENNNFSHIVKKHSLTFDGTTLELMEELIATMQGLALDWHHDIYMPIEAMLKPEILDFILTNKIHLLDAHSKEFSIAISELNKLLIYFKIRDN